MTIATAPPAFGLLRIEEAVAEVVLLAQAGMPVTAAVAQIMAKGIDPADYPIAIHIAIGKLAHDQLVRMRYATPDVEMSSEVDVDGGVRSGHQARKGKHAAADWRTKLAREYETADHERRASLLVFTFADWDLLRRKSESQVRTHLGLRKAARIAVGYLRDTTLQTADLTPAQQQEIAQALP